MIIAFSCHIRCVFEISYIGHSKDYNDQKLWSKIITNRVTYTIELFTVFVFDVLISLLWVKSTCSIDMKYCQKCNTCGYKTVIDNSKCLQYTILTVWILSNGGTKYTVWLKSQHLCLVSTKYR